MTSPTDFASGLVVGSVESVAPDKVVATLERRAPRGTALNARIPNQFPRLNGYVAIPSEGGAVLALITWIGVDQESAPARGSEDGRLGLPGATRRMHLVPLGTVAVGDGGGSSFLSRGVHLFPTVGDPVLIPTAEQLGALFGDVSATGRIRLGSSTTAIDATVSVDTNRLLAKHLAVLGNTGSGKSCTTALILRRAIGLQSGGTSGYRGARVIVLDTNGEYRNVFAGVEGVRHFRLASDEEPPEGKLRVPGWLWTSREWCAFAAASPKGQAPYVRRTLVALRSQQAMADPANRGVVSIAGALNTHFRRYLAQPVVSGGQARMNAGSIVEQTVVESARLAASADADVKAALNHLTEAARKVAGASCPNPPWWNAIPAESWADLAEASEAVLSACSVVSSADAPEIHEDDPVPFDVDEFAKLLFVVAAEEGSDNGISWVAPLILRIENLLRSKRVRDVVLDPPGMYESVAEWLDEVCGKPGDPRITVLDLSLLPASVVTIVAAVVTRLTLESLERYRRVHGHVLPTLLVAEEAHTFLSRPRGWHSDDGTESPSDVCREAFERVAREGRKYGLSLLLTSQRPSEISETVLSQCNTFIVHRITNDADQALLRRLVPDALEGLLSELPGLPSRTAVGLGAAFEVPAVFQVDHLDAQHRPDSDDPDWFLSWSTPAAEGDGWAKVADDWIAQPAQGSGADPVAGASSAGSAQDPSAADVLDDPPF